MPTSAPAIIGSSSVLKRTGVLRRTRAFGREDGKATGPQHPQTGRLPPPPVAAVLATPTTGRSGYRLPSWCASTSRSATPATQLQLNIVIHREHTNAVNPASPTVR